MHHFNDQSCFSIRTHHPEEGNVFPHCELFNSPLRCSVTKQGMFFVFFLEAIINNFGCHNIRGQNQPRATLKAAQHVGLSSITLQLDLIKSPKHGRVSLRGEAGSLTVALHIFKTHFMFFFPTFCLIYLGRKSRWTSGRTWQKVEGLVDLVPLLNGPAVPVSVFSVPLNKCQ